MFLKNCWYVAAWHEELDREKLLGRRILGERVLLYRTSAGQIVAFQDRCPHRMAPLSAGRRVRDSVQCGYHGMIFGPDGRCTHIPGQEQIPPGARVPTFPAVERHGHIWVWLGRPEKADQDLIPLVPWPALEGWAVVAGYTRIEADYRLLNDNLLDLSHESYLHEGTIGNEASQTIAKFPVQVSVKHGHVVRAHRDMLNIDPPPWFQMILETRARIDRWQTAIWAAPSINMTDTGAKLAGVPAAVPHVGRVLHLLTPETETSTHYFWSVNRNYRLQDPALDESLRKAVQRTFDEDKCMLELQQQQITETGEAELGKVALQVDKAPIRARLILSARIRAEQNGESGEGVRRIVLIDEQEGSAAA